MAIKQNVRCDKTGVVFDVSQKRIYVKDIKKLTNAQIEVLECGDYVVKKTGLQKHTYRVSYKEEKQGICLTYTDASTSETISYDYVDGVWTFNSQDITNLGDGTSGGSNVVANPTLSGTEEDLTGLEVDGTKYKVPQGSSGGGSAYVVSYYDMLDAIKDKHIDVEKLIEINTAKDTNFTQIEITIGGTTYVDLISTNINVQPYISPILRFTADSDSHVEIYMNGDYLRTESTTSNLVEVLTLNKTLIESTTLTLINDNNQDQYVGIVGRFADSGVYPYTVEEFKTIFKEVETTTEQTI